MKIKIFSWNLQSVKYCEISPNFIDYITDIFKDTDIAVIALQEDSIRDSPIMEIIEKRLNIKNMKKIESTEMSGWGSTTYKALKNNLEYLPRGLRLSVYVKKELCSEKNISIETSVSSYVCPSFRDRITWGKGAVAIKLNIVDVNNTKNSKNIIFSNLHLPFSSSSLKDPVLRKTSADWQATCLQYIYKNLKGEDDTTVFLAGDLNFRVDCPAAEMLFSLDVPEKLTELYLNNDELKRYIEDKTVSYFLEGVDNSGPVFEPTCKLAQGVPSRDEKLKYKIGKRGDRTPSWCDRILYDDRSVICTKYYRFEKGNMNLSDHCAVVGEFWI